MSHNVRVRLCPEKEEKRFQDTQLAKSPIRNFHFALCFFAKVEEQRTIKKHMGGRTRVDDQNVVLHLAFLASKCSLTTIAKEK